MTYITHIIIEKKNKVKFDFFKIKLNIIQLFYRNLTK